MGTIPSAALKLIAMTSHWWYFPSNIRQAWDPPSWAWWIAVLLGLGIAQFLAWKEEWEGRKGDNDTSAQKLEELRGSPELTLDCQSVNEKPGVFRLTIRNSGKPAINIRFDDITVPMFRGIVDEHETTRKWFPVKTDAGPVQWVIEFCPIDELGAGKDVPLRYTIANSGVLQSSDLGFVFGNSSKGQVEVSYLLYMEFSSEHGITWRRTYEMRYMALPKTLRIIRGTQYVIRQP